MLLLLLLLLESIYRQRLTLRAVADVSDPLTALTGEVPRLLRLVASDHHVVSHALNPRVLRHVQIRTAYDCTQTQTTSWLLYSTIVTVEIKRTLSSVLDTYDEQRGYVNLHLPR